MDGKKNTPLGVAEPEYVQNVQEGTKTANAEECMGEAVTDPACAEETTQTAADEAAGTEVEVSKTVAEATVEHTPDAEEKTAATEKEMTIIETVKPQQEAVQAQKKDHSMVAIVIGLLVFAAILAFCWKMIGGKAADAHADTGVIYAKDNNLHVFDLQNKAQIAQGISTGGKYNSYYSAWGTMFSEDGTDLYYAIHVQPDNTFDLYHRAAAGDEADIAIDTGVADYMVSKDGDHILYTKSVGEKTELYIFDGTQSFLVDDNIYGDAATYAISKAGDYIMYCKQSADGTALELYTRATQQEAEPILLEEHTAIAVMSAETNKIYFAGEIQAREGAEVSPNPRFAAYEYTFGKNTVPLMEGVTYLEVMPNGKDVLLMEESKEDVLYADLITDDLAEKDAAIKEGDEGYEGKKMRDEIRTMMTNGEGIHPVLQVAYIYSNGKLNKVATNVISAVAIKHDHAYAVCYQAEQPEKMPISLLESTDAIEYGYYSSLYYGMPKVSLVNATGGSWTLEGEAVQPKNIILSDDATMIGYYDMDMATGRPSLCVAKVGGEVLLCEKNVETAAFLHNSRDLVYYKDYINGMGTMCIWDGKDTQAIEKVGGLHIAPDQATVYYLQNMNNAVGQGDLYVWQDGVSTQLDTGVNNTQYKYNGKLTYIKNYDFAKGIGDLYYYNGKESIPLDTGVTAIYMF